MRDIVRVLKYLLYFKRNILLNILFNTLFVFFSLFTFGMIIPLIDLLFSEGNPVVEAVSFSLSKEGIQDWVSWMLYSLKEKYGVFRCILLISAFYIIFSFLSNLFRYLATFFNTPIRNGLVMRIRNDIYHRITILPISFFKKYKKGDVLSRFSSDLNEIETSVAVGLNNMIKDPFSLLLYGLVLVIISPKLVLLTVVLAPLTLFVVKKIGGSLKRNAQRAQSQIGEMMAVFEETLTGIKIIKAFGAEDAVRKQFREKNEKYARSTIRMHRMKEAGPPVVEIISLVMLVFIISYGSSLVINEEMNASVFIFFVIIFSRTIPSFQRIIELYYNFQKGAAAAKRIFEILDGNEVIVEKENPVEKDTLENSIRYKDVHFSYSQKYASGEEDTSREVLKGIDLEIKKGESVAIVGASGAGKTTMVDLLPRFYDCTSGEIQIDGIPVTELRISSLRGLLSVVSQECILFNDTILHNIAFGQRGISEEEVIHAAKIANADEFIKKLPQGYYSSVGERGLTLSGGQRQRISIARAILRNPDILILDEATSALDTESEFLVQEAITRLMQGRTSIIIAHRLSTIQHADTIVVLDAGKIVEKGSHAELIKQNGIYKKLVDFQNIM